MIKVKDGYGKLIGTTYQGSADHLLRSNGDTWAVHTGRNNEANKIVRTDSNRQLQVGWINTTSGNLGTANITRIYCSNDGYIRYKTPENFFSTLSNNGDNISITVASQNRTLVVGYSKVAGQLRSKGTISPQTGRTQSLGDVYSYHLNGSVSGGPTKYASVIGFGRGTSGTVEIAGEWTSGRGLWVRALRDTTDNWYAWDKVLTQATYTGITDSRYYTKTQADERFVNITGDTMTGELINSSVNAYRLKQSNYGVILRNDNNSFWILLTNSGSPSGSYNSLRPFRINLPDGRVTIGNGLSVTGTIVGSSTIYGTQLISTIATGTSPFTVSSTTVVSNLNADMLDGWHLSYILKDGYVTSGTAGLSSYWRKVWDITLNNQHNDVDINLLVHSAYNQQWGIISFRLRQNGTGTAKNISAYLAEVVGNIPLDRFRLYYNNSSGLCQLWCNPSGQYNVYNYRVLAKTWRTGTEATTLGTFYTGNTTTAQSLPSGSYVSMTGITIVNTAAKVANTLTFSAGKFSSKTYNGSSAITVNVPTRTSHLTNDSGFLTGNVIRAVSANGYWGMARPDSNTSDWIRTTSSGIIPYQSGGRGAGHCGLGNSSWYFSSAYIDTVHGNLDGTATNADKLDGFHANTSQNPFGKIPTIGSSGVMEVGRYLDFHYNSSDTSDYRTRLQINHSSGSYTAILPAKSGTLAMTSDIPTVTNYYWANVRVSSSSSTGTSPTFSTAYTSNWFRSNGNTGWRSESYGGGWYMTDSTWIRTYGSKSVYQNTGQIRTDGYLVTNGGITIGATSPNNGTYKLYCNGQSYHRGDSYYTAAIRLNNRGNNSIYCGPNDAANTIGGALNNLVFSSWNGVSFTTSCSGQTYTNKNAVSINCRTGLLSANTLSGNRAYIGGYNNTSYALSTSSFICNSWVRSVGSTGWYSQTYGGGIYMTDTTYVRVYNGKRFYASGGYLAPYTGSSWISMATRTNCIVADQNNSASSAHALFRVKNSSGHAIAFGGLGANIGFYGFYASRISSGANGTDWSTVWNAGTGVITHSKTIYTAGYYHSSVNSNNYVLLAGGSYKNLADFAKGNAGSSTQGVYVTGGTVKAMTYSLKATVNSGSSGKLAYYSGTNSIDDYTSTKGSSSTPIYLNAGIPTVCSGVLVRYYAKYIVTFQPTVYSFSRTIGNHYFISTITRSDSGTMVIGLRYPNGYTSNDTIINIIGRYSPLSSMNHVGTSLTVEFNTDTAFYIDFLIF